MQDLADKLHVSKVTISKALRNHPDISPAMTKLVRQTADDLGYIPNKVASTLSSRRTYTLGLVVPKIAHSFFSSLIESVYKYALELGYEIILTASQENPELERKHILTMISMKVDGILISATKNTTDTKIFEVARKNGIPIVQIDRAVNFKSSKVVFDDEGGAYEAVKYAIECGTKRIAFVGGNHSAHIGRDRLKGYKRALREAGIRLRKDWMIEGGFKEDVGYEAVFSLNERNMLPELIFAVTFPIALGVVKAARELKIDIPYGLDLISFGDSNLNEYIVPAISCVEQKTDEMAKLSVERIVHELESDEPVLPKTITIESKYLSKETCINR